MIDRLPNKPTQSLSEPELQRLLDRLSLPQKDRQNQRYRSRNALLALIMCDSGLRVGEAVLLQLDDVLIPSTNLAPGLPLNFQPAQVLRVRADIAKNRTPREIPLTNRVRIAIAAHAAHLSLRWKGHPLHYLFPSSSPYINISARQVRRIFSTAGLESIGRPVHPHMLRHTFATRLLKHTNTRNVQILLGHKNLTSTQIYTHPNSVDLREAIGGMEA